MSATQPARLPVSEYDEVTRWLASLEHSSDSERARMISDLERFCAFIESDPHALVQRCMRTTKSGDTAISAKGRQQIDSTIDRFAEAEAGTGHTAVVLGNRIRSFLIYNGVFMQGRASFR